MQPHLFPNNTRSNFYSYINPRDLDYISNESEIEVAVKSLTIDNDLDRNKKLVLKSTLSKETISSYGFDNIIALFSVRKNKKGINIYRFENPVFFPTTHERLCKPQFIILDSSTNKQPNFNYGSPTFIEVVVRKKADRMKPPFTILLDSSCKESLKRFPKNKNTDFTIQLPRRLEFNKDWMLCLKSIHFENKILPNEKLHVSLTYIQGGEEIEIFTNIHKKKTKQEFIQELQKEFNEILIFQENNELIQIKWGLSNDLNVASLNIKFSTDLSNILGIEEKNITLSENTSIIGDRKIDLTVNYPNHYIVTCNICEESVLSGAPVQILKYFPREKNQRYDIEFTNNDFVKLNSKTFDRIKIRITDLRGETITSLSKQSTKMQMLFVNINSK